MKRKLHQGPLQLPMAVKPELIERCSEPGGLSHYVPVDLQNSSGPWLCLPDCTVLLDAIQAGGALGFNAGACFGAAQYLESWTGQSDTENFALIKSAFHEFEARKPGLMTAEVSEPNDPANLALSYIRLNVLDQFENQVLKLEELNREYLQKFCRDYDGQFEFGSCERFVASFHCHSEDFAGLLCENAIAFGILLPINNGRTVGLRMSLSWNEETLEIFWRQMGCVAKAMENDANSTVVGDIEVTVRDTSNYFGFHQAMIRNKLAIAKGQLPGDSESALEPVLDFVKENLMEFGLADCLPVVVNQENWASYRSAVDALQREVYEPARQTPMEKFDKLVRSPRGIAILLLHADKIIAIAFAGPLSLFPGERGTTDDPWRNDPDALYMLDVTVRKEFRGSLGRLMKQALTLLAVVSGCSSIHGRNRDRLAAGMWAINLSVGSFQIQHLVNDYPDQEKFRDCIYYRCPLKWEIPSAGTSGSDRLAELMNAPPDELKKALARLVNGCSPWGNSEPKNISGLFVPIWRVKK
jgi:hypothetical protein